MNPTSETHPSFEILDTLPSMIFVVNPDFTIQTANKKFLSELSPQFNQPITPSDVIGHNLFDLIQNETFRSQLVDTIKQINQTQKEVKFEHPVNNDSTRTWGWTISPQINETDKHLEGLVFHGADITQKKEKEKKLAESAIIDPLTGLYNRRFYEDYLSKLSDGHYSVGQIIFDADGLKSINDTYGHDKGDQLLLNIAKILKTSFRPTDITARMGDKGDEFQVLMYGENLTENVIEERLTQLNQNILEHNQINRQSPPVSVSFGYSFIPRENFSHDNRPENWESIKKAQLEADQNMYLQKKSHKHKNETYIGGAGI